MVPFTHMAAIPRCTPHPSTGFVHLSCQPAQQRYTLVLSGQHGEPSVRTQTPLPCGYNVYSYVETICQGVMCLDGNS